MIVRVKDGRNAMDVEELDMLRDDVELDMMVESLPALERVVAKRPMHGLAPILEPDDDYDDFDTSAFVERTYQ